MTATEDMHGTPAGPKNRTATEITLHMVAGVDVQVPFELEPLRRKIAAAVEVLAASGASIARVHVQLVGDAQMDRYHRMHSGIAGTTDVLTFLASGDAEPIEVDIIACVDEARRRASEFGHAVNREILLYAVHGLLHCLGHDDHDPVAFEKMHAEEDRILSAIGVGPTFRPRGATS
jgi:probable rRNA maturation factor